MKVFYAHTDPENPSKLPEDGGRWHLLKDHLEGTAALASEFASAFGAGEWGYIVGLLHDLGKYSNEFQDKLRASVDAHIEQFSKVDHSTFGALQINKQWKNGEPREKWLKNTAENTVQACFYAHTDPTMPDKLPEEGAR